MIWHARVLVETSEVFHDVGCAGICRNLGGLVYREIWKLWQIWATIMIVGNGYDFASVFQSSQSAFCETTRFDLGFIFASLNCAVERMRLPSIDLSSGY